MLLCCPFAWTGAVRHPREMHARKKKSLEPHGDKLNKTHTRPPFVDVQYSCVHSVTRVHICQFCFSVCSHNNIRRELYARRNLVTVKEFLVDGVHGTSGLQQPSVDLGAAQEKSEDGSSSHHEVSWAAEDEEEASCPPSPLSPYYSSLYWRNL